MGKDKKNPGYGEEKHGMQYRVPIRARSRKNVTVDYGDCLMEIHSVCARVLFNLVK